jgi:two-component system, cell cycle sensor histidine kinase and response regulator CckA
MTVKSNLQALFRGIRSFSPSTQRIASEVEKGSAKEEDVTALQFDESSFRVLFDKIHEPIWVYDLTSLKFLAVNEAAASHYGYSRDEYTHLRVTEVLPPEDLSHLSADLKREPTRADRRRELRHRPKKGQIPDLEITSRRVKFVGRKAALVVARDLTERKIAERGFRDFLESAADAMVIVNKLGRIELVNGQTEKIFGYDRTELIGQPVEMLMPKRYRHGHETHRNSFFAGPQIRPMGTGLELFGLHKDGKEFPVEISLSPLETQWGVLFAGTIRDISDRRKAEEKAFRDEELFRLIAEHTTDLIAVLDLKGARLYNSPSYASILGDTGHLLGTDSFMEIHSGDRERIREAFHHTVETGVGRREEYRLVATDGRIRFIESQGDLVCDRDGKPEKVVVVSRDVTERKESGRQVRLLAQSLTSMKDCFVLTDMEDNILFVNPAFIETYGYSDEELLGRNVSVLRSPNNSPEILGKILPLTIAGGWNGELLNRRKDGSDFPVELWTSVVCDESGAPVALVAIARDISERRLSENERKSLEEQLRQAQKLESVGILAGGIAHDFNNILAIISGYTSLMARGRITSDSLPGTYEGINTAVQRGTNLVRQLLTFARKSDVSYESLDTNVTVEELMGMIRSTFPKSISVNVQLCKDMPPIRGDVSQIHQALLNLCVNARDAMPLGGTLTVRTDTVNGTLLKRHFADALHDLYVHVAVSDTGVGMDEDTRKRIFEPFFSTKATIGGTGLGLAVVYGVVKSHHAFIDVQSILKEGTTFHLYLPVSSPAAETQEPVKEAEGDVPGGHETILLVEDEDTLRNLIGMFLEGKGYRVLYAADGEDAVEMYRTHSDLVGLVFLDVDLPRLNGWDAFLKMKQINHSLKAIFTSGFGESVSRLELSREGIREILPKPYALDALLKRIREALDQSITVPTG